MPNILEALKTVIAYALEIISGLKAENTLLISTRDQAIAEAVAAKEAELNATKQELEASRQNIDSLNSSVNFLNNALAQKQEIENSLLAEIEAFRTALNPPVVSIPDASEPSVDPVPATDPVATPDPILETPVLEPEVPVQDPVEIEPTPVEPAPVEETPVDIAPVIL